MKKRIATVGLAPDGSWIDGSASATSRVTREDSKRDVASVNERLDDFFGDDDDDGAKRTASPEPGRAGRVNDGIRGTEKSATKTVSIVDRYEPLTVAGGGTAANPFPLGEFLGVDKSGDWIRFTAEAGVSAVTHREWHLAFRHRRGCENRGRKRKRLLASAPTKTSTR